MKNSKPLISIIIPVYKVEEFLPHCIDSVLAQTYKNIEVILVDDGSPDKCPLICDKYAKKSKKVKVIHQKNKGLSAARNSGVKAASGEFIYFLDSDDLISPDCIELLYNAISREGCDISVGKVQKFSDHNEIFISKNNNPIIHKYSSTKILDDLLINNIEVEYVTAWNKLIPRKILKKIMFPVGKYHEDEFTNWKFYYNTSSICKVEAITYYYYQRPSSITGNGFGLHNFDFLEAIQERLDFFKEKDNKYFAACVKQYRFTLIYTFYVNLIQTKDCSKYPYNAQQILELYKQSFKTYPLSLDRHLYSKSELVKLCLYYHCPGIMLLLSRIKQLLKQGSTK
ncbi:MAG: glycosyltransferase family 2 protein [Treponema sp.]|nr:glycosyltransferase family 2 protein [Treponema sp.]